MNPFNLGRTRDQPARQGSGRAIRVSGVVVVRDNEGAGGRGVTDRAVLVVSPGGGAEDRDGAGIAVVRATVPAADGRPREARWCRGVPPGHAVSWLVHGGCGTASGAIAMGPPAEPSRQPSPAQ